ncbi:MAG: hypothetical protein ACLRWP_05185 [Bilophila wadsworthia]
MTYRLSGRLLNKGLMGAVAALLLLMSLLAPARAELVQFVIPRPALRDHP